MLAVLSRPFFLNNNCCRPFQTCTFTEPNLTVKTTVTGYASWQSLMISHSSPKIALMHSRTVSRSCAPPSQLRLNKEERIKELERRLTQIPTKSFQDLVRVVCMCVGTCKLQWSKVESLLYVKILCRGSVPDFPKLKNPKNIFSPQVSQEKRNQKGREV